MSRILSRRTIPRSEHLRGSDRHAFQPGSFLATQHNVAGCVSDYERYRSIRMGFVMSQTSATGFVAHEDPVTVFTRSQICRNRGHPGLSCRAPLRGSSGSLPLRTAPINRGSLAPVPFVTGDRSRNRRIVQGPDAFLGKSCSRNFVEVHSLTVAWLTPGLSIYRHMHRGGNLLVGGWFLYTYNVCSIGSRCHGKISNRIVQRMLAACTSY